MSRDVGFDTSARTEITIPFRLSANLFGLTTIPFWLNANPFGLNANRSG